MDRAPAACFELVLQKLVYGGGALGHHEGRPVLVPGALPGERVEVETIRQAKGMVHARLLRVLAPAPERVTAPCRYFGRCGGCHYQHLEASRQLDAKGEILRETLRRIGGIAGGIDWPGEIALHAGHPWGYRNQVQLKTGRGEDGRVALGFFEADSHRLVPVSACLIASPKLNALIAELSRPEWTERLAGYPAVDLFADDRDERVMLTLRGGGPNAEKLAEGLAEACLSLLPGVVAVALRSEPKLQTSRSFNRPKTGPHRTQSGNGKVFGEQQTNYQVGEFHYRNSGGSFFQASRHLLSDFVKAVTSSEADSGGLALDLYAGVGLFTLPLSRSFGQVVAVEANRRAAADLAANVKAAGLTNTRAVATTAAEFLRRYAQAAPELAVLDPPRVGLEPETLRLLSKVGPRRIHYASCRPPTLARDLAFLLGHDYRLESLELFDLFPQTFHIESLARLSRAPSTGGL